VNVGSFPVWVELLSEIRPESEKFRLLTEISHTSLINVRLFLNSDSSGYRTSQHSQRVFLDRVPISEVNDFNDR